MPKITFHRTILKADFEIEANFSFLGTTVTAHPTTSESNDGSPSTESSIEISSYHTLSHIDSAGEAARHARPGELIALGILSYFSRVCFSVYDYTNTTDIEIEALEEVAKITHPEYKLVIEGEVFDNDLSKLISILESKQEGHLAASLLDRWRRANYLHINSGNGLHDEESYLGFFHIIELLTTEYQSLQRKNAEARLEIFLKELFSSDLMVRGNQLENSVKSKFSSLKDLLLSPQTFSVSHKILFMLNHMGFCDLRLHRLIAEAIKLRNEVAHGRISYKDSMVWPLRPIFSIVSQHSEILPFIEVLSARIIACHFGLTAWKDSWGHYHDLLHPPFDVINEFINKKTYESISRSAFEDGIHNFVRPASIADACLERKVTMGDMEQSLERYLMETTDVSTFSEKLAYGVALLCDASSEALADYCRELYQEIPLDNFGTTNAKNILRTLTDRGFSPVWLPQELARLSRAT